MSGKTTNLPLGRAIFQENRLITGNPLEGDPVGSRERMLFDPVTTEAKAEMAFLPEGKSMDAITRRPSVLPRARSDAERRETHRRRQR